METTSDLYQDTEIRAQLARLIESYRDDFETDVEEPQAGLDSAALASGALTAAEEEFFQSLLEKIYSSLGAEAAQPLPPLRIHTTSGALDMLDRLNANTAFSDPEGVHVGLGLAGTLDGAILVLTGYLIENFLLQISPPMGPTPRIENVIEVARFPEEAFKLYSDHLIPDAEAQDGYKKRPFQFLMEYLQAARFTPSPPGEAPAPLSRVMPKPLLDLVDYSERFDFEAVLQNYLDPGLGPYALQLHLQLLLDVLYFVVAHEIAHVRLQHGSRRSGEISQMRDFEAAADQQALELLKPIAGFQVPSLLFVFNFASYIEPDLPAEQMDHPLARNRMLVLADVLLRERDTTGLRATINAGLALLNTPLEPYPLVYGWGDGEPEEVDVFLSHYSDMDYTAHLFVYIDRPPRHVPWEDAWKENAFLLAHLTFDIRFVLRDRLQPDRRYAEGRAGYHPTVNPENLIYSYRRESVYTRLHLPISAPAEWMLAHPHAELAIESIEVRPGEPHIAEEGEDPKPVYFYYAPIEFELQRFVGSLHASAEDRTLRTLLLAAARRYMDYRQPEAAVRLYEWLYHQDPKLLPYGDLRSYCGLLLSLERYDEAETAAVWALGPGRPRRPGFHAVRMFCHIGREEVQEAYEQAFLEMAIIGEFGEFFEECQAYLAELTTHPDDPLMAKLRAYTQQVHAAAGAMEADQPELAGSAYRQAEEALLAAQSAARADFIFLRVLEAELHFELAKLAGTAADWRPVRAGFEAILERMPGFAPALIHLSRIALLEGDRPLAHTIWQEAYRTAPFHNFVFYHREQVEDPNPEFRITSHEIGAD